MSDGDKDRSWNGPRGTEIMEPCTRRVCLVTGGGGRLGTEVIRHFGKDHAIAAVYRHSWPRASTQFQELVDPLDPQAHLSDNDNRAFAIQADLESNDALSRVVELVLARFGRIDVLVNAAGNFERGPISAREKHVQMAWRLFRINAMIPVRLATTIAESYWWRRQGENLENNRNVINVSSTAGIYVYPDQGQSAYGAAKAALNMYTYHLASEFWNMGVRVNAVAPNSFPGIVATERVAQAIARLDRGDETGKILVVDKVKDYFLGDSPDGNDM